MHIDDKTMKTKNRVLKAIVTDAKLRTITVHKKSLAIKLFYENLSLN